MYNTCTCTVCLSADSNTNSVCTCVYKNNTLRVLNMGYNLRYIYITHTCTVLKTLDNSTVHCMLVDVRIFFVFPGGTPQLPLCMCVLSVSIPSGTA